MLQTLLQYIITFFLTPIVTAILTLPIIISKTYTLTFLQPTLNYTRQTAYNYIQTTALAYSTLTLILTHIFIGVAIAFNPTPQVIKTTILAIIVITLLFWMLLSDNLPRLQETFQSVLEFEPEKPLSSKKHTRILKTVLFIQTTTTTLVFLTVFFALS